MRKRVQRISDAKSPSDLWLDGIRRYAVSVFQCGPCSLHGPVHWQSVERFGLKIAQSHPADVTVVRLFALLHDVCRRDDGEDPDHGPRAADLLGRIVPSVFALDPMRLELLERAIRRHTAGETTEEPTIGACWDADRLDIGRVGIAPDPAYMSTPAGRAIAAARLQAAAAEREHPLRAADRR